MRQALVRQSKQPLSEDACRGLRPKDQFEAIDVDNSQVIFHSDVAAHYNAWGDHQEFLSKLYPQTWREWLWVLFSRIQFGGPCHMEEVYAVRMPDEPKKEHGAQLLLQDASPCTRAVMILVNTISIGMIIVITVVVLVESLPSNQNRDVQFHYSRQSSDATFGLTIVANVWFTVEFVV